MVLDELVVRRAAMAYLADHRVASGGIVGRSPLEAVSQAGLTAR